ncbi:MAG TPA: hypothetical protein VK578_06770 [Edaphobacter sp.]|nr:hypothetical protein [Edaphobacter sp.]
MIIGVIGEGIFETLASRTDTELRQRFSDELAAAEIQAGQANERASKAQQDAAELRVVADQLEEHNLDTGPRQLLLYGKRMDNFVSAIQAFRDQKVEIRKCQFNSKEIADTAERLTTLFERAKWNVSPHSPQWGESNCLFPDPLAAFGIWVGTPNPNPKAIARERAQQLVKLLNRIPLTASMHSVRVETARAESGQSEAATYGDPDAIVVVVLSHN